MPTEFNEPGLRETIQRLERDTRRLRRTLHVGVITVCGLLVAGFATDRAQDRTIALRAALLGADSVLQLRGLLIVDDHGVTRLRLGAPLPGPVVGGKEAKRAGPVSGMLVMDGDGDERGGFVTADGPGDKSEAFIGLDSKEGQVSLFLANAHDGANLQVWDQHGNAVRLYATGGSPRILVAREGKIAARLPADTVR